MHPLLQQRKVRIGAAVVAVLLLLLAIATFLLPSGDELEERHRPFVFDEPFDFAGGTLGDYIAWSERRIRAARGNAVDAALVEKLLPFRLEPDASCPAPATKRYHSGVVVTHDVLDSPYAMRELGFYFQSRCMLVFGLALPGHGSRAGELLQTNHEDWIAAQAFAARELAEEVDYLYLAGHGVGGTLAVLEAARNPGISGLVLFAPRLDSRLLPWQAVAGSWLGWLLPGARWADVVPEYTAYRYESRPWRLEREVNALVETTLAALPTRAVEVPVFLVATQEDVEASTEVMLDYMSERTHPLSQTLLYSGSEDIAIDRGTTLRLSSLSNSGILGLSHLGLMIPLYDPEFGHGGASRSCGHYYRSERPTYELCMAGERTVFGEITRENIRQGLLERLQFNPFFIELMPLMDAFLGPAAVPPPIQNI